MTLDDVIAKARAIHDLGEVSLSIHRKRERVALIGLPLSLSERELDAFLDRIDVIRRSARDWRDNMKEVREAMSRTARDTAITGLYVLDNTIIVAEMWDPAVIGVVGVELVLLRDGDFGW